MDFKDILKKAWEKTWHDITHPAPSKKPQEILLQYINERFNKNYRNTDELINSLESPEVINAILNYDGDPEKLMDIARALNKELKKQ